MNVASTGHRLPLAVHIVPYDAIGGAEAAARSLEDGEHAGFIFRKSYLVDKPAPDLGSDAPERRASPENELRPYLRSIRNLLSQKPDLVIASLWRSCLPLVALKVLRPRTRAVTFLHSAMDVHWVDKIVNRAAMLVSREIWTDSQATLDARVPRFLRPRARVISLLLDRQSRRPPGAPRPEFVFWGRLHKHKGLGTAIRVFALIRASRPDARFTIIGPDDGELPSLTRQVAELGLQGAVRFLGPMSRPDIFEYARSNACFYLQTSIEEGMAVAVIEAMQLGLLPVVTPAGEIGSYCRNGANAIVVESPQQAAAAVEAVLSATGLYERMTEEAHATWDRIALYRDDVLAACARLLRLPN